MGEIIAVVICITISSREIWLLKDKEITKGEIAWGVMHILVIALLI